MTSVNCFLNPSLSINGIQAVQFFAVFSPFIEGNQLLLSTGKLDQIIIFFPAHVVLSYNLVESVCW